MTAAQVKRVIVRPAVFGFNRAHRADNVRATDHPKSPRHNNTTRVNNQLAPTRLAPSRLQKTAEVDDVIARTDKWQLVDGDSLGSADRG